MAYVIKNRVVTFDTVPSDCTVIIISSVVCSVNDYL